MIAKVDENISYAITDGVMQVTEFLKEAPKKFYCWFANYQMKANLDKFHLITCSGDDVSICVENYLNSDSHLPKKFVLFASMKFL